ncbi:GNAT family N-acetyltransferase [Streptomyces racemochromogenes]|uniref:GNAT family N-acetyltransferase n=1 Tax=Streptomyces racemochromogenes TaxID=67353 RepID=A0ABW7PEC0_9ACTN
MTGIQIVAEQGAWRGGFEERLLAAYREAGCSEPLALALRERAVTGIDGWTLATDGTGWIAVEAAEDNGVVTGRIHDLTVPGGRAWAERWCAEQGARSVRVRLTGGAGAQPGTGAFADYPVRGQNRMRAVAERPVLPPGLTVRRLREEEYADWLAREEASYIADIVRAGALTPQQARQKSDRDFAEQLPQGYRTPGHAFYAMETGGVVIGTGWVNHGYLPGVTFGFSLEVHEEHRGRGHGRAAMAVGEWATRQGGDEALMFNVFGGNEVAMGLYDSTGFAVLDEFRSIDL